MTLHPSRIGDKGQRYQVEAEGYPDDGWNVIGWTEDAERADTIASTCLLAPGCTNSRVIDREVE